MITDAGGALHRVVSPLLDLAACVRWCRHTLQVQTWTQHCASVYCLKYLHAWMRPWQKDAARTETRVVEDERPWTCGRGRHGSTRADQKACGHCLVEGPDAGALLTNTSRDWKTAADVPSRALRLSSAAKGMSVESASRKIYRLEKLSWADWSHLHCLFGEVGLHAVERREDSEIGECHC